MNKIFTCYVFCRIANWIYELVLTFTLSLAVTVIAMVVFTNHIVICCHTNSDGRVHYSHSFAVTLIVMVMFTIHMSFDITLVIMMIVFTVHIVTVTLLVMVVFTVHIVCYCHTNSNVHYPHSFAVTLIVMVLLITDIVFALTLIIMMIVFTIQFVFRCPPIHSVECLPLRCPFFPLIDGHVHLLIEQQQAEQRREYLEQHREARVREAEGLQVKRRPSLLSEYHAQPPQLDRDR